MKFEWEPIYQVPTGGTARGKVPGGWIVNSLLGSDKGVALTSVFVPDPNHEWKLDE